MEGWERYTWRTNYGLAVLAIIFVAAHAIGDSDVAEATPRRRQSTTRVTTPPTPPPVAQPLPRNQERDPN